MDLDALTALAEPAGWALLAELPPYDEKQSLALGSALRQAGFDPALVSAALTQSRLRAKAVTKFGDLAHDMLFTPDGLEQATRLSLAARHAHRYAAAGLHTVADLGCGIGADAMALAGMDLQVLAVERDPATALVAGVNLRQLPEARVIRPMRWIRPPWTSTPWTASGPTPPGARARAAFTASPTTPPTPTHSWLCASASPPWG